ncbi:MAG: hypothetical protein AABY95_05325 [Pseudomonadota bacterium]
MDTVQVELPRSVVKSAQKITGERSARAAITTLVRQGESHAPNATTARALRSKKRGKVFTRAKDAIAYLKAL